MPVNPPRQRPESSPLVRRLSLGLLGDHSPRFTRALTGLLQQGSALLVMRLFRFAAIPWLTRTLSVEEFSRWALVMAVMIPVQVLADMGLGQAVVRFSPEATGATEARRLRATMLLGRACIALPVVLATELVAEVCGAMAIVDTPMLVALRLTAVAVGLTTLGDGFAESLRGEGRHRECAVIRLSTGDA